MVKLPDQFAAGVAPSMAVRGISPPDIGADAYARGVSALAQGIAGAVGAMGDAAGAGDKQQDALDLIKADTTWHGSLNDTNDAIANDGDHNNWLPTFDQKMAEARQQAVGQISNPKAREMADARFGLKTVDARGQLAAKAGAMERQNKLTQFQGNLADAQEQYYKNANDPELQTDAIRRLGHYIDMAQDSRIISPVQAMRFRQQYVEGTPREFLSKQAADSAFQQIGPGQSLNTYVTGQAQQQGQPAPATGAQPGQAPSAAPGQPLPDAATSVRSESYGFGPDGQMVRTPSATPQQGTQRETPDQSFARNSAYASRSNLTELTPSEESGFQQWVERNNVPFDPSAKADYDMRGFYKALMAGDKNAKQAVNANDGQMHFPDYWKTPYHRSFSAESQWAKTGAPAWNDKDQLVLPNGAVVFDERAIAAHRQAPPPTGQTATWANTRRTDQSLPNAMQTQEGAASAEKPIQGRLVAPAGAPKDAARLMPPAQTAGQPSQASVQPAQSQSNPLASTRARFAQELADNPALSQKVMAIAAGENNDPTSNRAVIESMMNRAAMMGTSLAQEARTTREGGYYAGYNPSALNNPQFRSMVEQNVQGALQGSNDANYATDNSSGNWGRQRNASGMYTTVAEHGGELFSYPSRNDARGHDRYADWRQSVGGGAQDVAAQSAAGARPYQQTAQAQPGTGTGNAIATDATYAGNEVDHVWNGIKLPPLPPHLATLTPAARREILDKSLAAAHARNGEMYQHAITAVNRDIDELDAGKRPEVAADGSMSIDRAKAILNAKDFEVHLAKWESAARKADTLAPLANMREADWDAHQTQMSAKPAVQGQRKIDEAFEKKKDDIRAERMYNPAGAVDDTDEVKRYMDAVEAPRTMTLLDGVTQVQLPPLTAQEVGRGKVEARLAAQNRLGIEPDFQRIVSRKEAESLMGMKSVSDAKDMEPQELAAHVQAAAGRAEMLFGPQYAQRAVEESIRYMIHKDLRAQLMAPVFSAAVMNKGVSPNDMRALELAHTLNPMADMSDVLSGGRSDTSLALPAVGLNTPAGTMFTKPSKDQVQLLQQNPGGWQAFDQKFGPGAAARALAPGAGFGKGAPDTSPGLFQGLRNAVAGSPENAMFKGAKQATLRQSALPGAMDVTP